HYQLRRTGRTQQSSAHTYRLLVFKEHIAGQSLPHHRLASLHQQQRNEIMNNPPVRVNKNFKLSFLANRSAPSTACPEHTTDAAHSRFLRVHRIAKERNSSECDREPQVLFSNEISDA
ncbi:hypothetical protein, partial [Caballeronia sp. INDeC2]|uniref:hypothetical protein n=1 Tax=Caballeronia sp. INDeC2 TaxID=2921747 RepID=UPI002028925B